MIKVIIGVLGLQGAIEDHEETIRKAAEEMGVELDLRRVILPEEIQEVDGLIMPGGESSAMTLIGKKNGMLDAVHNKIEAGIPAFGTCAGAILMSNRVKRTRDSESKQGAFPFLDAEIFRNGYGRQRESFATELMVNNESFKGIFIRAPVFGEIGREVEVLSTIDDDPVFIRQNDLFATTFHPELANDTRIHKMFLEAVVNRKTSN